MLRSPPSAHPAFGRLSAAEPPTDTCAEAPAPVALDATTRTAAGILAALVLLSCSYFFTGGGWNQASHFDLVRALVHDRTIRIDPYQANTGDKSFHAGHFYANKPPGTAFLAAPFVALTHAVGVAVAGLDAGERLLVWEARVATLVGATLPTVAVVLALYFLAIRSGRSSRGAAFGAVAFGLGTPAWAYGTLLWGHALAAACLMVAFALTVAIGDQVDPSRDRRFAFLAGAAAGWATITEFQAFGAAVLLLALLVGYGLRSDVRRCGRLLLAAVLGAAVPALLLGSYDALAFGSPWRLSYEDVVNFAAGHSQGFLGVRYPRPGILLELLVGQRRGLLLYAPVLVLAPWGLARWARQRRYRAPAIVAASIALYYLLFNAAFYYWWGGWSYGPRFLAPAMAFLCLGLASAWDSAGQVPRLGMFALLAVSVVQTLAGVSTNPMPFERIAAPLRSVAWPGFVHGRLSQNAQPLFTREPTPSFNAGEWIGLDGRASLIPLLVLWALVGAAWVWNERRSRFRAGAAWPVRAAFLAVVLGSMTATIGAMRRTSATFDEIAFIGAGARGYHVGRFELFSPQPPLLKYLYGLPVYLARPTYPAETAGEPAPNHYTYAKKLLWLSGNDPERLTFLARLVGVAFATALVLGVYRYTRSLGGRGAALIAATLVAFLPDVLAHGGVAYGDVPFAAMYLLALATLDAAVRRPGVARGALAGVAVALAVGTKLSALALLPAAGALVLAEAAVRLRDGGWWRDLAVASTAGVFALYLTLVAIYGGQPTLPDLRLELRETRRFVTRGHGFPSYLLGRTSERGWWYFYPVAFLYKTPAALHALLLLAMIGFVRSMSAVGGRVPNARALLASPLRAVVVGLAVFGAFLLRSRLDIGFRYALPALPLLCILAGVGLARLWERSRRAIRGLVSALMVAYVATSLSFYPNFLAYTSEYAPGRDRGDEVLLDSSLDWGQGLLALRDFMREERIPRVYLSYFGSALPAGYGIDYVPLPSFFRLPLAGSPRPGEREPEYLVISATHLHGLYLTGDPFAWLRSRRPVRVIAHTLFVYRLPSRAPSADR